MKLQLRALCASALLLTLTSVVTSHAQITPINLMPETTPVTAAPKSPSPAQSLAARGLPELLRRADGQTVQNAAQWPARRAEIMEVFSREVYGRSPQIKPEDVRFEILERDPKALNGAATLKRVRISTRGPRGSLSFELVLFTPNARPQAQAKAPTILLMSHRGKENLDPTRATKTEFWPVEELIARGYGAAAFWAGDVDVDADDNFQGGIHAIFDPILKDGEKRAPDAWGTIAAWSFGASRAMDYLQTDADVDKSKIGVIGHSRGGKTALWTGAQDTRFALTIANCSGNTGAALSRGKSGETIAEINDKFPHWLNAKYKQYNDRQNELPFDQHWLLATIAPRLLYVVSANDDNWADPRSEFLSALAAAPAWGLHGQKGLVTDDWAPTDVALQSGNVGYHRRSGGHGLTLVDWNHIMDFCDGKWRASQ